MMTKLNKFTVIIPTKNRSEYLEHTIRTCMNQDYENYEIIISDDNSSDDTERIVHKLQNIDSRIKLLAHKKHIGMRENFEYALSEVREGFVIALGGDDGLIPGAIRKLNNIINKTGKELVTWPLAGFTYSNNSTGNNIVYFERYKSRQLKLIKSKDFLNKVSKTFNYQIAECPMFYMKGVASIDLIKRVKSRTKDNRFYTCPTPDGYSGIVLAGEVEDYLFIPEPLSIGGTTIKSQGKNYQRTDRDSLHEAKQFFDDNKNIRMHEQLASQEYSPLVTLMTADYLLTVKDLPGWNGEFDPISMRTLLVKTFEFINHSEFEEQVLMRELNILKKIAEQHQLIDEYNMLIKKIKKKNQSIAKPVYGFVITKLVRFNGKDYGINNIYEASMAIPVLYQIYDKFKISKIFNPLFNILKILFRKIK